MMMRILSVVEIYGFETFLNVKASGKLIYH